MLNILTDIHIIRGEAYMKKASLLLGLGILLALTGCGKNSSQGSSDTGNEYKDGLIDLGPSFNEVYYPNLEAVDDTLVGKVDVVLVFEGREAGWEAVAREYERLHDGQVVININNTYSSETYTDAVKNQLTGGKTDWDIIQGNLLGGLNKADYTYGLTSYVYARNAYAGNRNWASVLEEDCYISDKTGASDQTYIMNSENLQTAWFVNTVALAAAKANGYTGSDTPATWNELLSLCSAMKAAGYNNPLGISLDKDSISASQFSWLLRVYGDYYFRDKYNDIAEDYGNYTVDLTAESPESDGFSYSISSLLSTILDQDSSRGYVGAKSPRFAEFVTNLAGMKDYISSAAYNQSFSQVRNVFRTQSNGKDSPQIMLDYAGNGLGFQESESASFKIDFFDHPVMESAGDFIPANTLLRDVGGNGGYLSVAKHATNEAQDRLSVDFMKFFLSPYGQSIYYKTLSNTNLYPQGITLVKNNLVVIPENWKTFFQTDKTTFSGLADSNPYISFLVRYMTSTGKKTNEDAPKLWANLLTGKVNDLMSGFQIPWNDDLMTDWVTYAQQLGYDSSCYLYPGSNPSNPTGK